jgi:hypothetical protein
MKSSFQVSIIIVILILASMIGVNLTQAQQSGKSISPTNAILTVANAAWFGQYVHQVDYPYDVGSFTSLALNPVDGLPYISYYDAYNGDLMLAHFVPNGAGNCGTNNKWYCETIDTDGDVGRYTSISIWSNSIDSYRIGISYQDVTNRSLKFSSRTCTGNFCTLWHSITIYSPVFNYMSIGLYTSLRFDPGGTAHIAYQAIDSNTNNNSLRYASFVSSGGNCGEGSDTGKWQCDIIDAGNGIGQYASLDLTYDGSPYLAYYDAGAGNLKMAYYTGFADPDCFNNNGWVCPILDSVGDVGLYATITAQHFVGDKLFRVAYYDKTNMQLKYYDADFGPVVVDDMGTSLYPMGISMDVDKDGSAIIAYQQITSEFSPPRLFVARPYSVYDDGAFGNCGDVPPGYIFQYWRCSILDNSGQYMDEAEYVSVAVSSSGLAQIAYSEYFDYDIGDHATSLKFISQRFQTLLPLINKP